jgi:hypothetical protein
VAETSASTTAADARAWLEKNGFEVALYGNSMANEHTEQTPQGTKTTNFVDGYRLLAPGSVLHAERWMRLEFLFEPTRDRFVPGAFLGVSVYDDWPPTKALQSLFASRHAATSPS